MSENPSLALPRKDFGLFYLYCLPIGLVFTFFYLAIDNYITSFGTALFVLLNVLAIFINARTLHRDLAKWIFLVGGVFSISWGVLTTGGLGSPIVIWLASIPLLSVLFVGWRKSVYFLVYVLCLITALDFLIFEYIENINQLRSPQHIRHLAQVSIFTASLYTFFIGFRTVARWEKAQVILKKEKQLTEMVIQSIREGIIVFNGAGRILKVNKNISQILNYQKVKIVGSKVDNFLISKFEDESSVLDTETLKQINNKINLILISKNNEEIPVSLEVKKISFYDKQLYVAVVGDLRLQKAHENLVEKNRQVAAEMSKLASLGELAGNIAHEINTPLTAILLSTGSLRSELKRQNITNEKVGAKVDQIDQIVDKISSVVTSLKNLGRKDEEHIELLKPEQLIADISVLAITTAKFRGIELEIHNDLSGTTKQFYGNLTQLTQVLINLINNAFDATGELVDKWVKVYVLESDDFVEFRIVDSGSGLNAEDAKKFFDQYYTSKPVNKGTGIGLSLAKKIIDNHRGELFFDESEVNTCFVVKLPTVELREQTA